MIRSRIGDTIDFEAVKKINEDSTEWYSTCPKCGVSVKGTLLQMRSHVCAVPHGE